MQVVYVAVLLDLADRPDLRETARDWQHRVDIHTPPKPITDQPTPY
jgi:hypothetical protein